MFSTDPMESAAEAGLRYVSGRGPCIRRVRSGRAFRYVRPDGKPLREERHLRRIRALVIPPAWTDVRICPIANGHLQAVGRDVKGRKQYRYHAHYREVRDQAKFSRMIAFGTILAVIRRRVLHDLQRQGMPKEKVLATVVRLLETTFIRVGNDEYARDNESFGLTTMRNRHVRIDGAKLLFRFHGKSGQDHSIELTDRRLARIVRQCRELPGYELFHYVDSAAARSVQSIPAMSIVTFASCPGRISQRRIFAPGPEPYWRRASYMPPGLPRARPPRKRTIVAAVKGVAARLGNRPATCRKYYIHPAIIDAYSDGSLFPVMAQGENQHADYAGQGLRPEEYAVMVIVAESQQKLAALARAS